MFWAAAGLLALFLLATAALLPGDASFDLANYHLYGPFALLHGKWDRDLAPAQLQTYLPPLADIPYYLLSRHLPSVRLLNLAASVPAVVAATLVLRITRHLLPPPHDAWRTALAAIAVLFGVTGAATLPVLGTSMSDMIPVSFVLAGVLVLIRDPEAPAGCAAAMASGLLVGAGVALKLTLAYAAAGLVLGLLAWSGPSPVRRLRAALLFGTVATAALLLVDGWWWIRLWRWSGNPLFPMYNDIFRSPLAPPTDFIDRRLLPHGWREAVLYPVLWAFDATSRVTEPGHRMRDPRIACALLASLALWLGPPKREGGRVRFLAVLFVAGFMLWEAQFSIFRYLSVLELLSGTMLAVLAASCFPDPRAAPVLVAGATLALLLACDVEIVPGWGRGPRSDDPPVAVDMRPLDRHALVLLLDAAPLAFLATATDPAVRFVGTNNNLTRPELPDLMQSRIRAAIGEQLRDHKYDLWGLEMSDERFGHPERALAAYRLRRTACFPVRTNIIPEPIRLCRLASG